VTAQLEGVQANAASLHGRLVHKEAELLAAQAEAAAQRRRVAETEEVLRVSKSGSSALEARGYEQYEQLTRAQSEAAEWECKSKRWSKERAGLQQKADEASRQASRRRDELYFTRTNMLREQLKLRQELEGTLPPRSEGGARLGHTTAQPAVHRHTTTHPSHWTGLDGIARSPRSLDHVADFEAELLREWRVAESDAAVEVLSPRTPGQATGGRSRASSRTSSRASSRTSSPAPPASPGGTVSRLPGTPSRDRFPADRFPLSYLSAEERRTPSPGHAGRRVSFDFAEDDVEGYADRRRMLEMSMQASP